MLHPSPPVPFHLPANVHHYIPWFYCGVLGVGWYKYPGPAVHLRATRLQQLRSFHGLSRWFLPPRGSTRLATDFIWLREAERLAIPSTKTKLSKLTLSLFAENPCLIARNLRVFSQELIIIVFDVGRTFPNTELSRDFIGLVVDGSMDPGMHI